VSRDVRLAQRGRIHDDVDPARAAEHEAGIADGADVGRLARVQNIEPDDLVPALPQGPDEPRFEIATLPVTRTRMDR
jgi:hypothetical protein